MSKYPKIVLEKAIRYMNPIMVKHSLSHFEFINSVSDNEDMMAKGLAFAEDLFKEWCLYANPENHGRLITSEVTDRFLKRIGVNLKVDDSDSRKDYEYFISYCLGVYCNDADKNEVVKFITYFGVDDHWSGFAASFMPTLDVLRGVISSDALSQKRLLAYLAKCGRCKESEAEDFEKLSLEEKLKCMQSPYFDDEFYVLYRFFGLPVRLIIKYGDPELYVELLSNYSLPQFRGQVIHVIKDPLTIIRLFKSVVGSGRFADSDNRYITAVVIRDGWYDNYLNICKNYAGELDTRNLSETTALLLSTLWTKNVNLFKEGENDMLKLAFQTFVDFFGEQAVSKWLFSKTPVLPPVETETTKIMNETLEKCKNSLLSLVAERGFSSDVTDLSYISSFLGYFSDKECGDDLVKDLYETLMNGLRHDQQYLSGSINNTLIDRIDVIANFLVSKFGPEIECMCMDSMAEFKVRFEGIYPTPLSEMVLRCAVESQFLLISLYITTFDLPKELRLRLFKNVTLHLLKQCYYCERNLIDNYYLRVLIFGELIADQRLAEIKDEFEEDCIKFFPDFLSLVTAFAQTKKGVSATAGEWIKFKTEGDWPVIRERLKSCHGTNRVKSIESCLKCIFSNL